MKIDTRIIRVRYENARLFEELNLTLQRKLEQLQQSNIPIQLYWQDTEEDWIRIVDEEDFSIAFETMTGPIYKLIVLIEAAEQRGKTYITLINR